MGIKVCKNIKKRKGKNNYIERMTSDFFQKYKEHLLLNISLLAYYLLLIY